MGSTPFLGSSYPSLLIVFLNLLFFRNLYHIFLAASVGTLSGSFFIFSLFFCTIFWVSLKGQVYSLPPQPMIYRQIFARKSCRKNQDFCTRFCSHKNRPIRGGDSFLFIYFIFLPVVLVLFLYSIFCLCPSFRVWSDGLYFLFGVFLP